MICAIARLSPDADEKLQSLRKAWMPAGRPLPAMHGHITLASYLPEDDAGFMRTCTEIYSRVPSFRVRYDKLEVLAETSVIVAVPSGSEKLRSLHERAVKAFGSSLDRWTCGDSWIPHTTLIHDPAADLETVCRMMRHHFIPFEAEIRQIELSKVETTGYTVLKTIDLK